MVRKVRGNIIGPVRTMLRAIVDEGAVTTYVDDMLLFAAFTKVTKVQKKSDGSVRKK